MDWLPASDIAAELDRIADRLQPAIRGRLAELRTAIGAQPFSTVGGALAAAFPDAANEAAAQRALLRLVEAVNKTAKRSNASIQLQVAGAKQLGDRRSIGFARQPRATVGRADLSESANLPEGLETRQADVPSRRPKVYVAVWTALADRASAQQLTELLRANLDVSPRFQFIVRERHAEVLAGGELAEVRQEVLDGVDFLVVGLSVALLGNSGWTDQCPEIIEQFLDEDRCLPVLLRPLPKDNDLRCFANRAVLTGAGVITDGTLGGTRAKQFAGSTGTRESLVELLGEQLHAKADRALELAEIGELEHETQSRARTEDWLGIKDHKVLPTRGSRGFQAGRTTPDVPDVAAFLASWAVDPASTSLLALLGDSGIGKTICSQQLARTLWDTAGPAAHYFDLRDVSGLEGWAEIPPVHRILAACIAGSWTEASRPIDLELASQRVVELLADSQLWPTVLIIDGLDEVLVHLTASAAQKFTNQLLRLRPLGTDPIVGPGTKLMLSCRTHYFTDIQAQVAHFRDQNRSQLREEDYTSLVLLPVTREQMVGYLSRSLGWTMPQTEAFLGSVHDLWDLGSRPFLLNQLAEVLPDLARRRDRGETIVVATVYQALVQRWLHRDQGKHVLDGAHKPEVMAYLAYRLWLAGTRSAPVATLGRWLAELIESGQFANRYREVSVEILANDLHTATFLVRRDEGDRGLFRFAHSSLGEYFLAEWLVRCVERDQPEGWAIPVPGRETLQFCCELLSIHWDRDRLLRTLASWRTPYRKQASELLLACGLHGLQTGLVQFPLAKLDLKGAELTGLEVIGSRHRPVNLSGANLQGAKLDRSRFEHAVLRDAKLAGANLNGACWNEVSIKGTDLAAAWATGGFFRRCQLSGRPAGRQVRVVDAGTPLPIPVCAGLVGLTGHAGPVSSVAVLADGRVVSGSDGSVRVWDPDSGECLVELVGHTDWVRSVAMLADGRLISGSDDHSVRVWDPDSGQCLAVLTEHTDWVWSVAVLADGRVVSGSSDLSVRVWDPDSGQCLAVLVGHTGLVRSVAVLADGRVVSGSEDGSVRVWDPDSGECLVELVGHTGSVLSVAVLADGRVVSGSSDHSVRVWDPDSGQCLAVLTGHISWLLSVAVLADGRVVSGGSDGSVRVWDPDSGECLAVLVGHTDWVRSVAVLADGRLISGSDDHSVRVWDPDSGQCLAVLTEHISWLLSVAVLADGRVVSGSSDLSVRVWDPDSGQCLAVLVGHTGSVRSVAVLADGRLVSGGDGSVQVWDPDSGECLVELVGHTDSVWSVAMLADGRLVSGSDDGSVRVWDPDSGQCLAELVGHTGSVRSVAVLADGRLISGGSDGSVRVWDPDSGQCLTELVEHTDWVRSVAVLADGRVVSGSDDHSVRVWDPDSGQCLAVLVGHTGSVLSVAVLADGRVVSGSDDHSVRVWDPDSGQCLVELVGHTDWVRSVAVLADGRVVSGSDDGSVRVWDPDGGRCLTELAAHPGGWAAWQHTSPPRLRAFGDAWRWLRVRVRDADGRLISQDPYEWYFPTEGNWDDVPSAAAQT